MTLAPRVPTHLMRQLRGAALCPVRSHVDFAAFARLTQITARLQSCVSSRSLAFDGTLAIDFAAKDTTPPTTPLRYNTHGIAASSN